MFWPKISPNKAGDDYHNYCKHDLIKYKPWTGLKNTAHGGDEENKTKIINLWEEHVKSAMSSGGNPPDHMQT